MKETKKMKLFTTGPSAVGQCEIAIVTILASSQKIGWPEWFSHSHRQTSSEVWRNFLLLCWIPSVTTHSELHRLGHTAFSG